MKHIKELYKRIENLIQNLMQKKVDKSPMQSTLLFLNKLTSPTEKYFLEYYSVFDKILV